MPQRCANILRRDQTNKESSMHKSKTCKKCKQIKSVKEYNKAKDNKDGLAGSCKACVAKYDKQRYEANKETLRAKAREKYYERADKQAVRHAIWYQENKEPIAERRRIRRLENIDKYLKQERDSYQRNKEQKRAYSREYTKKTLDKSRERNQRRRARIAAASDYKVTAKELRKIANSSCAFCGTMSPSDVDHIIPLARGGNHGIGNLQPLCDNCNSTKYNKTIMEWRVYRMKIGNPLPIDEGK